MSVEFNDEMKPSVLYSRFQASNKVPTLVKWILATGVVKTNEQANVVLIIIMLLAFSLTGVVIYRMNGGAPKISQAQIDAMRNSTLSQTPGMTK